MRSLAFNQTGEPIPDVLGEKAINRTPFGDHADAHVLTDNGSEFMKHFDDELRELCLITKRPHWGLKLRTPTQCLMNYQKTTKTTLECKM